MGIGLVALPGESIVMSQLASNFIKENTNFLAPFHSTEIRGNLLVEEMGKHNFINHCMCMQAVIINQALRLRPIFLHSGHYSQGLARSYVPTAVSAGNYRLRLWEKAWVFLACHLQIALALWRKSILAFRFDGVRYGDIAYDAYLVENSVGTFEHKKLSPYLKMKKIFFRIARRHIKIKKIIKLEKIDAVLVSHKIGIQCGVMVRAALSMKRKAYSNAGLHRATLFLSDKKTDMVQYEYEPTKKEIEDILTLPDFDSQFERIHTEHLSGASSLDAKYAFNDEYGLFPDRSSFCDAYSVDVDKKNIFVMLHAFTDYPHSHFPQMLFRDYLDWFRQTLDFAYQDDSVNWFFKRHPSDKFYPTNDVDFTALFADAPQHITFLDSSEKFDTRNLKVASDAVITCIGSAGFEMAALYGIPCIVAGDSAYSKCGFVLAPQSQEEYFSLLGDLKSVKALTREQQKEAQAFYMFKHYYSTVDYDWNPVLTFEEHRSSEANTNFYGKVLDSYETVGGKIKKQIISYANEVARPDFRVLRKKQHLPRDEFFAFPFGFQRPLPVCAPEIFIEGCQILTDMGASFCIADGTLLGLYRDGKLIEHDRDLDVALIRPFDEQELLYRFCKQGFRVGRQVSVYGKSQQIVFYKNEVVFDIEIYERRGDVFLNFCEADYYFKHEARHFEHYGEISYQGMSLPMPAYPEEWLRTAYGSDWRTPAHRKAKDWREETFVYGAAIPYDGNIDAILLEYPA